MDILALDTAAAACSAALWRDGKIVAHDWRAMARGHAEALVPMIGQVMKGARYDALAAIGVTVGPGAFTGLRIGLATARGLALATGAPAVGVTSFAVAAHVVAGAWNPEDTVLVIALETKREDLYLQAFGSDECPLGPPASVAPDDIASWPGIAGGRLAIAGDAAARLARLLPDSRDVLLLDAADTADAAVVAEIAAERVAAGLPADAPPPRPLYLRPPDVTLPVPRRRGTA